MLQTLAAYYDTKADAVVSVSSVTVRDKPVERAAGREFEIRQ
jgi:hypothetical protein